MSSEPVVFDPALEGLLREIAADPRSSLLRVPRPRTVAGLLARQEAVRPSRSGLSAAERHLLEVHRDELADLLRRACLTRFFSDPSSSIYLNRSKDAHEQIEVDTPEQWRARARDALEDARRAPAPLEGLDLIEACLRPHPGARITVTQLARASQRLQPTDVAEVYVGLDTVLGGSLQVGRRIQAGVLESKPNGFVRSCILENLGFVSSTLGDIEAALTSYRESASVFERRPSTYIGWLLMALQCGNSSESLLAGGFADEAVSREDSCAYELVRKYRLQRKAGSMKVSRPAQALARRLSERFGPVAREVANAIM